jgi:integrase
VSIRKRGQNYWELCIPDGIDPTTGKQVRSWYGFRGTQREAEKEHTRLERERDLGIHVMPSKVKLTDFMERWLTDHARLHVSARTLQGYRDMVRLHITPRLGTLPLGKVRPVHLQAFYSDRLDNGRVKLKKAKEGEPPPKTSLAPQTVLHLHRLLHEALGTAVKWGLLAVNPADAVTPPKVRRNEPTILTEEQTVKLLEATVGTRLHMPVLLAVATGLRRGELLALRWSDIDLKAGTLTVNRTLSEIKEIGLQFKEPKSRTSRRVVALPAFAVAALKDHAKAQKEYRLSLGAGYKDQGLVLPATDGQPWAPNLLTGAFGSLVRRLDVPTIRLHDLRHGHITQLLLRGVPLKVVSARAGHAGIAITGDLYGHLLPGADEQAAAKMDDVYTWKPAAAKGKS